VVFEAGDTMADALGWLEDWLKNYRGAIVIVSHDRAFIQRVATGIWELRDGQIKSFADLEEAGRG
jgi:ATPase subunit of ABC transporter with duplicated ATPase domains